jgi:hypothetical protein
MSASKPNRWNWLLAPVGYATLIFLFFLGEWWWQLPTESGSLNFSLDPGALWLIFNEAQSQGVIVLVISLASVVAMYVVGFTAALMRNQSRRTVDSSWLLLRPMRLYS